MAKVSPHTATLQKEIRAAKRRTLGSYPALNTGQFDRAVTTAQTALALASVAGDDNLANQVRMRLELYKQRKPYREPVHAPDQPRP